MQCCAEEAEEAYLLPVLQPLVKPVRETPVLCAVVQLKDGCEHSRKVDQGEHDVGHARQGGVDDLYRDLVEFVLLLSNVGMQDLPDEVVGVEAEEEAQGQEDGNLPGREKTQRNILYFPS